VARYNIRTLITVVLKLPLNKFHFYQDSRPGQISCNGNNFFAKEMVFKMREIGQHLVEACL
jgi:hypothetical protein